MPSSLHPSYQKALDRFGSVRLLNAQHTGEKIANTASYQQGYNYRAISLLYMLLPTKYAL